MEEILKHIVTDNNLNILVSANFRLGLVETFKCDRKGNPDYSIKLTSAKYPNSQLAKQGFHNKVDSLVSFASNLKTKKDWNTGSICNHLIAGDCIDDELQEYLMNKMTPKVFDELNFVVGWPSNVIGGQELYMTFVKSSGIWEFIGNRPLITKIKSF